MKKGWFFLFLISVIHCDAQVKTITVRKTLPYDTQHVTLSFDNSAPVMPRFVKGKSNYDLEMQKAYNKVVKAVPVNPVIRTEDATDSVSRKKDSLIAVEGIYYQGPILDKAIFVKIQTYCDTDGSIIVLSQEKYDV